MGDTRHLHRLVDEHGAPVLGVGAQADTLLPMVGAHSQIIDNRVQLVEEAVLDVRNIAFGAARDFNGVCH